MALTPSNDTEQDSSPGVTDEAMLPEKALQSLSRPLSESSGSLDSGHREEDCAVVVPIVNKDVYEDPILKMSWGDIVEQEERQKEQLNRLNDQAPEQQQPVLGDSAIPTFNESGKTLDETDHSLEVAAKEPTSPRASDSPKQQQKGNKKKQKKRQKEKSREGLESARKTASPGTVSLDSGKGSELEEDCKQGLFVYQFQIQGSFAGALIGLKGINARSIVEKSGCQRLIVVRRGPKHLKQDCFIKGSHSSIEMALGEIRELFPASIYPDLDLSQTNKVDDISFLPQTLRSPADWALLDQLSPRLSLCQGYPQEVLISSYKNAGHFFVQLPRHPTASRLDRLLECMNHAYHNKATPGIIQDPPVGTLAAARLEKIWHRVQVLASDPSTDQVFVRYIDVGEECILQRSDLRKIRSDFISLPFQAVEVRMANVIPVNAQLHGYEFAPETSNILYSMLQDKYTLCQVLDYGYDGLPLVSLTCQGYAEQPFYGSVNSYLAPGECQHINSLFVDVGIASPYMY